MASYSKTDEHVIVDEIDDEPTHKATIVSSRGVEDGQGRLMTYETHNVQYYITEDGTQQEVYMEETIQDSGEKSNLICLICEGQANGIHFGAMSCAACNAFFRRSVAENRKYVCRKDGNCVINFEVRCFCRACRLKKCLEVGMDPKAVQPHRDSIGKKTPKTSSSSVPSKVVKPKLHPISKSDPKYKPIASKPSDYDSTIAGVIRNIMEMPNTNIVVRSTSHSTSPPPVMVSQAQPMNASFTRAPQVVTDADGNRFLLYEYTMEEEMPVEYGQEGGEGYAMDTNEHRPQTTLDTPTKPISKPLAQTPAKTRRLNLDQVHTPTITKPTPVPPVTYASKDAIPPSVSNSFLGKELLDDDNILKSVLVSYQAMKERRRLIYCPRNLKAIFSNVEPEWKPTQGGVYFNKEHSIPETALIAEFLKSIKPFAMLSVDDKIILVKNCGPGFACMEKYYITYQKRGHEQNRIYHQNYTYVDIGDEKAFLQGSNQSPEDPKPAKASTSKVNTRQGTAKQSGLIDPQTMRELNLPYMRKALKTIVGSMAANGMTDLEFIALVLTMLFDANVKGLSEIARRVIASARNRVYEEWMAYYDHINVPNGAEKVGNTVLILSELQEMMSIGSQNFHMTRLFGVSEYDELMDDVYL